MSNPTFGFGEPSVSQRQPEAPNGFVAETIWDLAAHKIYDIVWVPVMLMIRESRTLIPLPEIEGAPPQRKKLDIYPVKEDFGYWPAVVQNIFTSPYRELWYGPLCVEEVQSGRLQVVSTQIFKHITQSHIRFAYAIKLINLNMSVDIVLAEDELKPYVIKPAPYLRNPLTEHELICLRNASADLLLYVMFNALTIAEERASRVHRLTDNEVVPPTTYLQRNEYEVDSVLVGSEVIKYKDIVRVKVRTDKSDDYKLMYFKINSIVCNRETDEVLFHGLRLYVKPVTEEDQNREYSFMIRVTESMWHQYKDVALYKDHQGRKMMCIFKIASENLYQIRLDRILGRFYQGFPELGLDMHLNVS